MDNWVVRELTECDAAWLRETFEGWGGDFVVTRGPAVYPEQVAGFVAEGPAGERLGMVTYEIRNGECEAVTLDAFVRFKGIGTALLQRVCDVAAGRGIRRVWLITTNDNLEALRFYQRRGFSIAAVHANALQHSRELKPTIPMTGNYGIPLRDDIELERLL